jgi:ubiquitin C-terminal hydrolase
MKLYALVVHAGGSSYSGHYYAFVRVGDNWFKVGMCLGRWTMGMFPSAVRSQF